MSLPRLIAPLFLLMVTALGVPPTHADGLDRRSDEQEERLLRDQVRDLVRQGKLLPLATLKARVLEKLPGDLIDVSVDREHGVILYEFRVLRAGGRVTEVEIDAASGKIVEIENE